MRETTRSLGAFFVLSGLLSLGSVLLVSGSMTVLAGTSFFSMALLVGYVLSGIIGIAFVYVGARLKHLLQHKPNVPIQLTIVSILLAGIRFSIFGVLINVYIYYQLRRMAKEAETELEEQVLT